MNSLSPMYCNCYQYTNIIKTELVSHICFSPDLVNYKGVFGSCGPICCVFSLPEKLGLTVLPGWFVVKFVPNAVRMGAPPKETLYSVARVDTRQRSKHANGKRTELKCEHGEMFSTTPSRTPGNALFQIILAFLCTFLHIVLLAMVT